MHRSFDKPTSAHLAGALPEWLLVPILASLVAISGLIVLVGWLVVKPAKRAATAQEIIVEIPQRILAAEFRSVAPEENTVEDDDRRQTRPVLLQRRIAAGATQESERRDSWEAELLASSHSPDREPLPAPIRWIMEPLPMGTSNLMMPIEIAKIDDGVLLYRLRRLHLADQAPKQLRLAVTPVAHDDLGQVLRRMGDGYSYLTLRRQELLSAESLRKQDVVFLTCSDLYAQDFLAAPTLRRFVEQGGTLYASDLCGDLVLATFPEFRAPYPLLPGIPQSIDGRVLDQGLQSFLGKKTIPLSFDAPDWRPAAFDPSKVQVCLGGVYRNNFGHAMPVPLLVRFRVGAGTVIFTSFHHTKNDSATVQKLLEYLVFASVNARSEGRVKDLMQRSRFAPQDLRPLAMTKGKATNANYLHQGGDLQIAVGFENLGARLKLTLVSPTGRNVTYEDQGLYLIEIPAAEAGLWRYTVTPLELPYANFPIIVAVGTAKIAGTP